MSLNTARVLRRLRTWGTAAESIAEQFGVDVDDADRALRSLAADGLATPVTVTDSRHDMPPRPLWVPTLAGARVLAEEAGTADVGLMGWLHYVGGRGEVDLQERHALGVWVALADARGQDVARLSAEVDALRDELRRTRAASDVDDEGADR